MVRERETLGDDDYDPKYSTQKKGGYYWGHGFVDPTVALPGPKHHKKMTDLEASVRMHKFQYEAKRKQSWYKRKWFQEDSDNEEELAEL